MLRPVSRMLAVVVLLSLALPSYAASTETPRPVGASVIAPEMTWTGQQYVAADAKGRVFILHPQEFRVYPVDGSGELGEPRELEARPLGEPSIVRGAAMDKHGDWVILFGGEPRWFPSGEEKSLPQVPWMIGAVGLLKGQPVVATYPFPVGRWTSRDLDTRPPLVLQADRDDWSVVIESELREIPDRRQYMPNRVKYDAHLLVDSDDTLWLAGRYRYHVENYSSAGRELLVLEVGDAEVEHRDEADVEDARVELEKERGRYSEPSHAAISTNTAIRAVIAMAEGRDGLLYLLVDAGKGASGARGGFVLDRLDTTRGLLERVPVSFSTPGTATMAAGKNGLYVVPFNGKEKRYFVSWEALLEADWSPVEGVEMNGQLVEVARGEGQLGE